MQQVRTIYILCTRCGERRVRVRVAVEALDEEGLPKSKNFKKFCHECLRGRSDRHVLRIDSPQARPVETTRTRIRSGQIRLLTRTEIDLVSTEITPPKKKRTDP